MPIGLFLDELRGTDTYKGICIFFELYNTNVGTHKHVDVLIGTEKVSQIITNGRIIQMQTPKNMYAYTHPSEKVSWQISRLLPRGTLFFFKLHGTYSLSMHARTQTLPHKHLRKIEAAISRLLLWASRYQRAHHLLLK